MAQAFVHRETVRFGDLDAMRHLNNIAFLRDLAPGHDPADPERGDMGFIFAEGRINYRSPVVFDEVVEVHCTVGEVGRSAFRIDYAMEVGDRHVADGYGWLVGYDYAAQKAMQLPTELRESLEEVAGG